jgi:hypothetical protein
MRPAESAAKARSGKLPAGCVVPLRSSSLPTSFVSLQPAITQSDFTRFLCSLTYLDYIGHVIRIVKILRIIIIYYNILLSQIF